MPFTPTGQSKSSNATVSSISETAIIDFDIDFLLMEDGSYLLLESGDKIIQEPNDLVADGKTSNATVSSLSKT